MFFLLTLPGKNMFNRKQEWFKVIRFDNFNIDLLVEKS